MLIIRELVWGHERLYQVGLWDKRDWLLLEVIPFGKRDRVSEFLRMVQVYGFVTNHKKKNKRTNCNKCGLKTKTDSKFLFSCLLKTKVHKRYWDDNLGGGGRRAMTCLQLSPTPQRATSTNTII